MTYDSLNIGTLFSFRHTIIFFGNRNATEQILKNVFPNLSFRFLKQIHSSCVLESNSSLNTPSADAHFTNEINTALFIRTADCCPVFWATEKYIFAIHAGWKGVQQDIILNSLSIDSSRILRAFIGPSIGPKSFEVEKKIAELIVKDIAPSLVNSFQLDHISDKKVYIDLTKIIIHSLKEKSPLTDVTHLDIDTLIDTNYFSYRRNPKETGRNLSFIAKREE